MTEISFASPLIRSGFLVVLLALLVAVGWFITRTAFGDSLTAVARSNAAYDVATKLASADAAVQFAAWAPNLHYQRGQAYLAAASGAEAEGRLKEAVAALRTATERSPEDYRSWLALGQALDRSGATAEAKKAYTQTLALAPNYYEPHWVFANYLLRSNETAASFAEFKRALAIRPTELPLLFDYAWDTFNGDVPTITKALAPSVYAQAQFAGLLIERGKMSEGVVMWRELNNRAPALARIQARPFISSLLAKHQYRTAHDIWQAAAQVPHTDAAELTEEARQEETNWYTVNQPDAGSWLSNGDFENDLRTGTVAPFSSWRLTSTKGLLVSRNNQQHKSGQFSLQLSFDVTGNLGFAVLEQLLPIQPSTSYRLTFAARLEDLQTLSAPLIEASDPADLKRLHAATKPFPLGTAGWQEYTVDFTTAAATEAVRVRVFRPACGEPPCPIRGKIWLDNFKLEQKR